MDFIPEVKTTYIKKVDGVEGVTIKANIANGYNFNKVLPELESAIKNELSSSTQFVLKGTSKDQMEAMGFLLNLEPPDGVEPSQSRFVVPMPTFPWRRRVWCP